jgi:polyphenol oxidase
MQFITAIWPAPDNIYALTTTRHAGNSQTPYASCNLAHHVGDHVAHVENNRRLLTNTLNLPSEPVWLTQEHSAQVISLEPGTLSKCLHADAVFTQTPNIVCTIMTADCLPILICNKNGTIAAAIHAGWRGLSKGIIENTVQALKQPANDLLVWLGPAIGPNCYEVSQDFYDMFVSEDPSAREAFKAKSDTKGKWLANLYTLAKQRLNKLGLTAIYGGEFCTFTDQQNFYSARRDKGITGRMATLIWFR